MTNASPACSLMHFDILFLFQNRKDWNHGMINHTAYLHTLLVRKAAFMSGAMPKMWQIQCRCASESPLLFLLSWKTVLLRADAKSCFSELLNCGGDFFFGTLGTAASVGGIRVRVSVAGSSVAPKPDQHACVVSASKCPYQLT